MSLSGRTADEFRTPEAPRPMDGPATTSRATVSAFAGYAAAGLAAAAILLTASKADDEGVQAGDRVTYAEDYLGRPWRVMCRHGSARYELRCGTMKVFADQDEIRPYEPPTGREETLVASDDPR